MKLILNSTAAILRLPNRSLALALVLLTMAGTAFAKDQACHVRNKIVFPGAPPVVLDQCVDYRMPLSDADDKQFRNSCNVLANAAGSKGSVRLLQSCPTAARGVCDGVMGAKVRTAYYNPNANELAEEKKRCTGSSGI